MSDDNDSKGGLLDAAKAYTDKEIGAFVGVHNELAEDVRKLREWVGNTSGLHERLSQQVQALAARVEGLEKQMQIRLSGPTAYDQANDHNAKLLGEILGERIAKLEERVAGALDSHSERLIELEDVVSELADAAGLVFRETNRGLASQATEAECTGPSGCHGTMMWCESCGDVRQLCDDMTCDVHRRAHPSDEREPAQVDLPEEAAKVLRDHRWELYEGEPAQPIAAVPSAAPCGDSVPEPQVCKPGAMDTVTPDTGKIAMGWRVAFWDAVNAYAESCGGSVYGNVPRMNAVAKVESLLRTLVEPASRPTIAETKPTGIRYDARSILAVAADHIRQTEPRAEPAPAQHNPRCEQLDLTHEWVCVADCPLRESKPAPKTEPAASPAALLVLEELVDALRYAASQLRMHGAPEAGQRTEAALAKAEKLGRVQVPGGEALERAAGNLEYEAVELDDYAKTHGTGRETADTYAAVAAFLREIEEVMR